MWIEELPNGKFKYFERYKDPYTEKDKRVSITLNSKSNQAKKQAMNELQEKIVRKKKEPLNGKKTWYEVYDEWWAIYKNTVKYNTLKSRVRDQKKLAKEFPEDILVRNIDSNFLTDILTRFYYEEGLSKSYIEQLHAHINLVLKYAKKRQYIKKNPMSEVKIDYKPKTLEQIQKANNKYLEKNELRDVISYSRTKNQRFANLIEFMALTGTRIGEAVALKFEDTKNDVIEIKSTFNPETASHGTPKNGYSYRKIDTTSRIQEIINEQKDIYLLFKHTNKNFLDEGYIFFSKNGTPIRVSDVNRFLRERVAPNVNIHGKNLTTHIFRHTHISLLAELGVPLKFIMERVGHNSPKTTLSIYTHVTEGMKDDFKQGLDSLIFAP